MRLPRSGSPGVCLTLPLRALIADCLEKKFTGAATVFVRRLPGSLIFKGGRPLCAEFGDLSGGPALEEMAKMDDIVAAKLYRYSDAGIETVLLFNDGCRVTAGPHEARPATTIHAVQIGNRSRPATVKVVREVSSDDDRPARSPISASKDAAKKEVLTKDSVRALKEMRQNFTTSASDILKEMHMEHLIVAPEKKQDHK